MVGRLEHFLDWEPKKAESTSVATIVGGTPSQPTRRARGDRRKDKNVPFPSTLSNILCSCYLKYFWTFHPAIDRQFARALGETCIQTFLFFLCLARSAAASCGLVCYLHYRLLVRMTNKYNRTNAVFAIVLTLACAL
jgi:hypothetical protein